MDMWKLWLYALQNHNASIFCDQRNVHMTHDMGMIFKYRLGNGTPARLTSRRVKASGTLSSFRVAERTLVMRSFLRPTQILNSFMLRRCSEHLSRLGMGGGYLELGDVQTMKVGPSPLPPYDSRIKKVENNRW